jgi:hypothetical protein
MFKNTFAAELLKYRRSLSLWLAALGGFFPALVALLFLMTGESPADWETVAATSLNFFNMLSLLLVSVLAGQAFAMEYHGDGDNRMHVCPVPRGLAYLVKLLVAVVLSLAMHGVFLLCLFTFGGMAASDALSAAFALRWTQITLLCAAANIALAPLAAMAGILLRSAGAYILTGIGCFVLFMSFMGSQIARWIPPCVPSEMLNACLASGQALTPETAGMLAFSAAVFLILACAGAVCYVRVE